MFHLICEFVGMGSGKVLEWIVKGGRIGFGFEVLVP